MLFSLRASGDDANERQGEQGFRLPIATGVTMALAGPMELAVKTGVTMTLVPAFQPGSLNILTGSTVAIMAANPVIPRLPISTGVLVQLSGTQFRIIQTGITVTLTANRPGSSLAIDTGSIVSITPAGQVGFSRTRDMVIAAQPIFPTVTLTDVVLLGVEFTRNEFKSIDNIGGYIQLPNAEDMQFTSLPSNTVLSHSIISHEPTVGRIVFDLKLPSWTTNLNYPIRVSYGGIGQKTSSLAISTGSKVRLEAAANEVTPPGWPYPQSALYQQLSFNRALTRYGGGSNGGSDEWPSSTDDDNRVLLVGADGTGFNTTTGGQGSVTRTEWRVSRVGSAIPANNGTGLSGFANTAMRMDEQPNDTGNPTESKPSGVLAFNNTYIAVWYQFERYGDASSPYNNWQHQTHLALSTDDGATFTLNRGVNAFIFREGSNEDLTVAGVLQLGPGYVSGPAIVDRNYIYVYLGNHAQLPIDSYAAGNGNTAIWLARVKWAGGTDTPNNLLNPSQYEMFTGLNASGNPTWGTGGVFGTPATRTRVFFDANGLALNFNVHWHASIGMFVATWIHAGINAADTQGIAVAISDSPWDQTKWRMIAYGSDLDNAAADEADWYLSVSAPVRWSTSTDLRVAVSTYVTPNSGGSGDNLIVTSAALTAK